MMIMTYTERLEALHVRIATFKVWCGNNLLTFYGDSALNFTVDTVLIQVRIVTLLLARLHKV